ncbi:glycosyltransferase family 2 protein [Cupriavidus sp. 30B13]|uniref:glycosyltransferase family 2 protein n=1 Tax=Cupriavidus sp. 30B13 TaxID=3384241 RepID=UPI003B8FE77E
MSAAPSVTLMIPTYRRLDMLQRCLHAASALAPAPAQWIVVCRGAADADTAAWLAHEAPRRYPRLRTVMVAEPGVVAAMNAGLPHVTGELLAILDDDALPRPDWLARLLPHFADPAVGGAGGRDVVYREEDGLPLPLPEVPLAGYRDGWGRIVGNTHRVSGPPRAVETLKGCNWILRRTALGTARFDERLHGQGAQPGNEAWMCQVLRHAGWQLVLDPAAIVDHYPAARSDYGRQSFARQRCFEEACNITAISLAYAPPGMRLRLVLFQLLIGSRNCPGAYYLVHSLLKRPRCLPGQLLGGWGGFLAGCRLARTLRAQPPGRPGRPPGAGRVAASGGAVLGAAPREGEA